MVDPYRVYRFHNRYLDHYSEPDGTQPSIIFIIKLLSNHQSIILYLYLIYCLIVNFVVINMYLLNE